MDADLTEPPSLTGRAAELALHSLVLDGCVDDPVLRFILPEGRPHGWEGPLWDYKRDIPDTSTSSKANESKLLEWVKDAVSFYNAFGGYILAGIDQYAEEPIRGVHGGFRVEDLNAKIRAYTRINVQCRFRRIQIRDGLFVGLLHIPMRPVDHAVVQFVKGGPEEGDAKAPFKKGDIYVRVDDACIPVNDDIQGIQFASSGRTLHPISLSELENNLPPRDPNLIRFVGRSEYLLKLWSWLVDRHNPVKVLTAMGGTGKTAITYEFATQVLGSPPSRFSKVIWLTAKRQAFSAIQGRYVEVTRTDFSTPDGLLSTVAEELGWSAADVAEADGKEGLIDLVLEGLQQFPALVIVDDVDTLSVPQQADLFSTVQVIAGRAFSTGSRILLTSRLELGAGEDQLIRVKGFEEKEFSEFIKMVASERNISISDPIAKRIHAASFGSPVFGSSILRLVTLGTDINAAIKTWKGKAGEDVRRFAFQRELDQLTDAQARALYTLSVLGETTQLELCQVLTADEDQIAHDLGVLRQYHLFAASGDPSTGAKLVVPEPIRLMTDILRARLVDPVRIDKECARARNNTPKVHDRVAIAVGTIIALWKADDYDGALMSAEHAVKLNPKSGDLNCILGQCYLKVSPMRAELADKSFRLAFTYGCARPELIPYWLEAKRLTRDLMGIVDLFKSLPPTSFRGQSVVTVLDSFAELGRQQLARGDAVRALESFKSAMTAASRSIVEQRAGDQVAVVRDICRDAARQYVTLRDRELQRPRDRIDVFNAVLDAFDCHVTETWMIDLGVASVRTWAETASAGSVLDPSAVMIMERRLEDLKKVALHLEKGQYGRGELALRVRSAEKFLTQCLRATRPRS